jgi:hypothetical protein
LLELFELLRSPWHRPATLSTARLPSVSVTVIQSAVDDRHGHFEENLWVLDSLAAVASSFSANRVPNN